MPASGFDICFMQETRNNFEAMRPAPVCADINQSLGQNQKIHISTNCYYGYHDPNSAQRLDDDCEMMEVTIGSVGNEISQSQNNVRKRSASDDESLPAKRHRQDTEIQKEKQFVPETTEKQNLEEDEDALAIMLWNTHGGHLFHLTQCL